MYFTTFTNLLYPSNPMIKILARFTPSNYFAFTPSESCPIYFSMNGLSFLSSKMVTGYRVLC